MFDKRCIITNMTPEYHRIIQEWAFENEYGWGDEHKVKYVNKAVLCLNPKGKHYNKKYLGWSFDKLHFEKRGEWVIDAQAFINIYVRKRENEMIFDTDIAIINMTPEYHRIIQEWAFENGWAWLHYRKGVSHEDVEVLYLNTQKQLTFGYSTESALRKNRCPHYNAQNFIHIYINKSTTKEDKMSYSFKARLKDIDLERIDRECHASGHEAILVTCAAVDKYYGYLMLHNNFLEKFNFNEVVYHEELNPEWGNADMEDFEDVNGVVFEHYRVKWVPLDSIDSIKRELEGAREYLAEELKVNVHVF